MELRDKIIDAICVQEGDFAADEIADRILNIPEIKDALAAKVTVDHINSTYKKSVESAARSRPMI